MPLAATRRPPRLLQLALAIALLGVGLVLAGDPAAAQQAPRRLTIEGTADNKWQPADATIRPGGTVTFQITGGATHPVLSGDGSNPAGDDKFDASDCGLQQMTKVGDSCQVEFPDPGTFPYFCQVHVAQGMKGVITVADEVAATTTTGAEAGPPVGEPPVDELGKIGRKGGRDHGCSRVEATSWFQATPARPVRRGRLGQDLGRVNPGQ